MAEAVYEHRRASLLSRPLFLRRLALHFGLSSLLLVVSLAAGMWGYSHFEALGWRDAFLNASMLLGGMGPVDVPRTPGGKLFAGVYALYAGLVFLVAGSIMLAPALHRLLHRLHLEDAAIDEEAK
jgi:hypothetical protein